MYKFDEDKSLDEIKKYIDKTYEAHYNKNKYQCTEMIIIDSGHGRRFLYRKYFEVCSTIWKEEW